MTDSFDEASYLPDGDSFADSDSWDDDEGFRVDFSSKEAGAEAFENKPIPAGWYHVAVTEVAVEEVKSGKNMGKPMFNFKMVIQDGEHKGRVLYNRLCLFAGALYSISMAMKAQGLKVEEGNLRIPPAGWWTGKTMLAQVKVVNKQEKDGDKYVNAKDEKGALVKTNDVGGYKKLPADWDPGKAAASDKASASKAAVDSLAP